MESTLLASSKRSKCCVAFLDIRLMNIRITLHIRLILQFYIFMLTFLQYIYGEIYRLQTKYDTLQMNLVHGISLVLELASNILHYSRDLISLTQFLC